MQTAPEMTVLMPPIPMRGVNPRAPAPPMSGSAPHSAIIQTRPMDMSSIGVVNKSMIGGTTTKTDPEPLTDRLLKPFGIAMLPPLQARMGPQSAPA